MRCTRWDSAKFAKTNAHTTDSTDLFDRTLQSDGSRGYGEEKVRVRRTSTSSKVKSNRNFLFWHVCRWRARFLSRSHILLFLCFAVLRKLSSIHCLLRVTSMLAIFHSFKRWIIVVGIHHLSTYTYSLGPSNPTASDDDKTETKNKTQKTFATRGTRTHSQSKTCHTRVSPNVSWCSRCSVVNALHTALDTANNARGKLWRSTTWFEVKRKSLPRRKRNVLVPSFICLHPTNTH